MTAGLPVPVVLPNAPRPTFAQVSTVESLEKLVTEADQACAVAISIADLDTLHEVITSTRALVALVMDRESWVTPALAHLTASSIAVAGVRRRGEQR